MNTSGQVLGMDTAASAGFSFQSNDQSSGSQGYAIPINTALNIAKAIEAGSSSTTVHIGETAFLGVEISPSGNSLGSGGGGFFGGNCGKNPAVIGRRRLRRGQSGVTDGPARRPAWPRAAPVTPRSGGNSISFRPTH